MSAKRELSTTSSDLAERPNSLIIIIKVKYKGRDKPVYENIDLSASLDSSVKKSTEKLEIFCNETNCLLTSKLHY